MCPHDVEDIAQFFPSLEHLEVDGFSDTDRLKSFLERGSRRELSTSLGKLTAIRTLKIDLLPHGYITNDLYNDMAASLGPSKVLSVAHLPDLQKLEVPLYMFTRRALPGLEGTTAIPREVLPRSLKTLVLLNSCKTILTHQEGICLERMADALEYLESFGDDFPCLPHLESVAYCPCPSISRSQFSTTVRWNKDDEAYENSILHRLQLVRTLFSRHNIQFLLQNRRDRQTIDLEDLEE